MHVHSQLCKDNQCLSKNPPSSKRKRPTPLSRPTPRKVRYLGVWSYICLCLFVVFYLVFSFGLSSHCRISMCNCKCGLPMHYVWHHMSTRVTMLLFWVSWFLNGAHTHTRTKMSTLPSHAHHTYTHTVGFFSSMWGKAKRNPFTTAALVGGGALAASMAVKSQSPAYKLEGCCRTCSGNQRSTVDSMKAALPNFGF